MSLLKRPVVGHCDVIDVSPEPDNSTTAHWGRSVLARQLRLTVPGGMARVVLPAHLDRTRPDTTRTGANPPRRCAVRRCAAEGQLVCRR